MAARFVIVLTDEHCKALLPFAHSLRNAARHDSIGQWHTDRLIQQRPGVDRVNEEQRKEAHAIIARVAVALANAAEHNVVGRPANES